VNELGETTRLIFDAASKNGGTMLQFAHADWKAETDYFISTDLVPTR